MKPTSAVSGRRASLPIGILGLAVGLSSCSAPDRTPAWEKSLPPSSTLQSPALAQRGVRLARGIIHLHSPYSHDACDGDPQPQGRLNAPCLADLRRGLCVTRMDFAMLTDHATHMTEAAFPDLFMAGADDVLQGAADGAPRAARWRCPAPDGAAAEVLITAGGENELMPVGLQRHLGATPPERAAAMHGETPQAVKAFQEAGAVVLVPHGESRSLALLRSLAQGGLDGMEIYNLHANIDPKIRATDPDLNATAALASLGPWLAGAAVEDGGPEPDLAVLGFLEANSRQIGKLNALLAEGLHLTAMMGSDIHQNTLRSELADGERGDSYRRLMRWFSNHLLVSQAAGEALAYERVQDALRSGRSYGAFEVFGSPQGFDFHGALGGRDYEMGETMLSAGGELRVTPPRPLVSAALLGRPGASPPRLRVRLLRVDPRAQPVDPEAPGAALEVLSATLTGAADDAKELALRDPAPGAYRVEVLIVPNHLIPLLGASAEPFRREYPYLYSSPIYVAAR